MAHPTRTKPSLHNKTRHNVVYLVMQVKSSAVVADVDLPNTNL